jgi:membrane-bound lytic murein transglycosylase D
MNFTLTSFTRAGFFLCVVLILSSCAEKITYNTLPVNRILSDSPEPKITEIPVEADPDLQLVKTGPEMCLDQELVALSKTGIWAMEPEPVTLAPSQNATYDFPIVRNKQVDMYLDLFQNRQRKQFGRWLARSTKYQPLMTKELTNAGLPLDLIYLSMIESGFIQRAQSKSRAVGLWQFMRPTGRQYNLRVDKYVDERKNAVKSSKAAASYLSDLYNEFGDWHLAVAAYNGGPGKIRGGLRRYKVDNFWDLASHKYLKLETKRYVPKLIAAIIIAKDPEKYGFFNIPYQNQLQCDTLKVGPGMPLDAVALISSSTTKKIKLLNQELRQSRTPLNRSSYTINIPKSSSAIAEKNIARLHSTVSTGFKSHKIQQSETLSTICKKYGINKTTLLKVNNLRSSKLVTGRNLRIPYSTVTYQLLPKGSSDAMAAYKESLILHHIKPGETISKIAFKYNIPPGMIVQWNGLESVHKIRAGQQLALYINRGGNHSTKSDPKPAVAKNKTSLKKAKESDKVAIVPADKEKIHISNSSNSYRWYQVQNGDSLWAISRKFRISTAEIKKWNNLKSNLIHPGITLKLKKG